MQGLALVDYDNVCEAYAPGRRGRAGQRWSRVGVVTDDDDLVPALLAAHAANGTWTIWVRSRRSREGLNDRRLAHRGLRIHRIEEGTHV